MHILIMFNPRLGCCRTTSRYFTLPSSSRLIPTMNHREVFLCPCKPKWRCPSRFQTTLYCLTQTNHQSQPPIAKALSPSHNVAQPLRAQPSKSLERGALFASHRNRGSVSHREPCLQPTPSSQRVPSATSSRQPCPCLRHLATALKWFSVARLPWV